MPEEGALRSTKGMPATPLTPPSLTTSGERATVAPRGWLHLIPLISKIEPNTETEYITIDSFPTEVCEME